MAQPLSAVHLREQPRTVTDLCRFRLDAALGRSAESIGSTNLSKWNALSSIKKPIHSLCGKAAPIVFHFLAMVQLLSHSSSGGDDEVSEIATGCGNRRIASTRRVRVAPLTRRLGRVHGCEPCDNSAGASAAAVAKSVPVIPSGPRICSSCMDCSRCGLGLMIIYPWNETRVAPPILDTNSRQGLQSCQICRISAYHQSIPDQHANHDALQAS
jgi:hypothetical protein